MAQKVYIGVNSKKVTLKNLFPEVNANGFSGTNVTESTTHTKYTAQALRIQATTSASEYTATQSRTIALDSTHKYYARVEIYQEAVVGSTALYWPINDPPFYSAKVAKANQWTMVSAVNTRSTFTSGNYNFRIDFDNGKKAGNMWFDGLMLIDLTACFGAGNEPDVAWCDANIPYFTDRVEIKVEYPVSSGVARKVKKIYIGVDGVARRVKKAYIGVGGVAKCFWSYNSIEIKRIGSGAINSGYTGYGLINPKVFAVGNSYFAVGGGQIGENGGSATTLQIFNDEGTKQSTTLSINSTVAKHKGACESVGNYGVYSSATSSSKTIKAVDTSLTSSTVYMPSSGSPRVWARLPNYALCVYSIGMAVDSSLTTKAITSNKVQLSYWGMAECGNSYAIAHNSYNKFDCYNTSLTYSSLTNTIPFDGGQPKTGIYTVPHVNGTIVISSGLDTDDGEEYKGDDILFINTSLTISHWGTKGTYEYPACRMRLAGKSICCGHGQNNNTDTWTWVWDESLTRTQPSYVTAAACGGASSISEDWGVVVGGVRTIDGTDRYAYYGMNILTT